MPAPFAILGLDHLVLRAVDPAALAYRHRHAGERDRRIGVFLQRAAQIASRRGELRIACRRQAAKRHRLLHDISP